MSPGIRNRWGLTPILLRKSTILGPTNSTWGWMMISHQQLSTGTVDSWVREEVNLSDLFSLSNSSGLNRKGRRLLSVRLSAMICIVLWSITWRTHDPISASKLHPTILSLPKVITRMAVSIVGQAHEWCAKLWHWEIYHAMAFNYNLQEALTLISLHHFWQKVVERGTKMVAMPLPN